MPPEEFRARAREELSRELLKTMLIIGCENALSDAVERRDIPRSNTPRSVILMLLIPGREALLGQSVLVLVLNCIAFVGLCRNQPAFQLLSTPQPTPPPPPPT
jgi:hypothetical protein